MKLFPSSKTTAFVLTRFFLHLFIVILASAQLRAEVRHAPSIRLSSSNISVATIIKEVQSQTDYTFSYIKQYADLNKKVLLEKTIYELDELIPELMVQTGLSFWRKGNVVIIREKPTGTVKGTVSTSDGNPAGFVSIAIPGQRSTQSDIDGKFILDDIEAGIHTIVASYIGLSTQKQQVNVVAGHTTSVSFTLSENTQTLQEVVVRYNQNAYNKPQPSSSLRIETPIIKTPQSIITVSRQLLEDQQVLVMTDAAKNVSGVTTIFPYVGVYTDFNIRGSRATQNRLRNGMSTSGWGGLQEDMSYVENVEFIKGPAGFMLAQGEPGGMYNVVTKKPLGYRHLGASFTTGSYGLYRASVDYGNTVGKEEKLGYRVNLMNQFSGTHFDYGVNNRFSFAPVLQYRFNNNTVLTAEYNMDLGRTNGAFNNVSSRNGQFLRRSFTIEGPQVEPMKMQSHYGYLNLQHRISDNWKFTAQVGTQHSTWGGFMFSSSDAVDAGGNLPRNYTYYQPKSFNTTGQFYVNGKFNTGSVAHKILVGVDGGVNKGKSIYRGVYGVLPINVDKPTYATGPAIDTLIQPASLRWGGRSRVLWQAVSFQDDITVTDWLQLTLGGRFTHYENSGSASVMKDDVFTPRLGIVLQPLTNTSLYALYDQSFIAQSGVSFSGDRFEPLSGNNLEVGIKKEWFSKRLLTQLAFYKITKNNVLTGDRDHPGFSIQRGQIQSKGIELDVIGAVTDNLNIVVNYAHTDARITKDSNPMVVGQRSEAPRNSYNLWAKYQLHQGRLKGLGIGLGGSYYQDQYGGWTVKKNSTDKEVLADFKSLNAAIYYNIGKLSIALNVDNLTDAFNYLGNFDYNLGQGGEYTYIALPGRNWRLTTSIKF